MNLANPYAIDANVAAHATESERTAFIRRTYTHLAAAVIGFVCLEGLILTAYPPAQLAETLLPLISGWGWLLVLGGFMLVSWIARSWADSTTSIGLQYAGLGLYVVAEAVLFLPLMAISLLLDPSGAIPLQAGLITGIVFAGLTAMVFLTRADFSWMGRYLMLAGFAALAIIAVGIFTGFSLGLFFSGAMVLLASGYILYDTSNILHHYQTNQHVAASLALFASVALLLWYVMQILISLQND